MLFEKLMQMNEEINELYEKETKGYTIALLGNPNVGKSTVFNGLTGMKQHTGNWPGKTVELASGTFTHHDRIHEMIDLPGTYSLLAHSSEEEVARNFVCFEKCDVCLVVCDATMLERNMNLVLQTMEITNRVVVIVNLMDEAEKKHIHPDLDKLANLLQVEVVGMSARNGKGFRSLKEAIEKTAQKPLREWCVLSYDAQLQQAIERLAQTIHAPGWNHHFLALKLLDPQVEDEKFYAVLTNKEEVQTMVRQEQEHLKRSGCYEQFEDIIVNALQKKAKMICDQCVKIEDGSYLEKDMRMDRIVTHKVWGFLCMIVLLALIFWITIAGANVPSAYLSAFFVQLEAWLHQACEQLHVAKLLEGLFVDGMVKTAGWVIAVMLPPMAIFFPLFTLLEDFGYLPRIAFNLDGFFQKACTCGKQALTMAMGFGCNAVGVSGARIIDSPRERLIAILTNVFVPCNGRFPTLISIITMFFAGMFAAPWNGLFATLLLTLVILFGIFLTFLVSKVLSKTLLKGIPSSFSLELPPYRRPQFGKVILRSIFDRTLFVLGRAISVALPAGIIIWLFANVEVQGITILAYVSGFLDPFAKLMGLDGVILLAFLLGFPANEIVVPIMIMAYMASGSMNDLSNLTLLKSLFVDHGWTWITAICTLLFSLVHFPCATTLLTIHKETQSWKWTWLAFLIPTILGILLCMSVNAVAHLILMIFPL